MNLNNHTRTIAYLLACATTAFVHAGEYPSTDEDFAALPPYCEVKLRSTNKAAINKWSSIFGPKNWVHIHHYCAAMNDARKANLEINSNKKIKRLKDAVYNYGYIEKQCQKNFVLMPEVFVKRAQALHLLGDSGSAIHDYKKAIHTNPKYIYAYSKLADLYLELNLKKEAADIINKGLKIKPKSKSLNRRLKKLEV